MRINESISRPLKPGVWAPVPSFFLPDTEDLDIATFSAHVVNIAKTGMGILVAGSMGEAHHLEPEERIRLIKAARSALDSASLTDVPIIAGTGVGSTRETLNITRQAAEAGADYAIVIASGYFAGQLNNDALLEFWLEVADKSPIPVLIYNYPGASGGLDLDSDAIEALALQSPNICGVKLTCGNVGKLTRIAATVSVPSFEKSAPRRNPNAPFLVLGGFADFLLPSAFARAHGAITGLGNVAPHTIVELFRQSAAAISDPSLLPSAQRIQDLVSRGDRAIAVTGIAGTKYLVERLNGYSAGADRPRKPLRPLSHEQKESLWQKQAVQELLAFEGELRAAKNHFSAATNGVKLDIKSAKSALGFGEAHAENGRSISVPDSAPFNLQPSSIMGGLPAVQV